MVYVHVFLVGGLTCSSLKSGRMKPPPASSWDSVYSLLYGPVCTYPERKKKKKSESLSSRSRLEEVAPRLVAVRLTLLFVAAELVGQPVALGRGGQHEGEAHEERGVLGQRAVSLRHVAGLTRKIRAAAGRVANAEPLSCVRKRLVKKVSSPKFKKKKKHLRIKYEQMN